MKHTLKKAFVFLLCMVVLFGATTVNVPYETVQARTIYDVEKELEECKALLKTLQGELASIQSNINSIQDKTGQQMELIKQYQAEIDALDVDISINNAIKESYDIKRAQVVSEIALAKEDYDYRVSMYLKLMQFIYENGNTNSFELLFSSENISEYLTRRDNFNDIMNAANNLIKEIEISIADLEALDADLAETQAEYESYVSELELSKLEKDKKVKEFETLLSSLNLDKDAITSEYANKNQAIQEVKAKISKLEEERKEMYESSAEFIWPTATISLITSTYGYRKDPINGSTAFHNGIDIAAPRGTPIYATKSGVVTRADWYSGYGKCVIIYHGGGVSTLYGHCDSFNVSVGDSVKAGQVIAYVGTTGRSTGYHLHFSVMTNSSSSTGSGNYVNPDHYLPDGYYTKNYK